MRAYLVQHGEANSKESDPERHLSDRGKANAASSAAFLKRVDLDSSEVWHSGKARAKETADILGPAFGASVAAVERAGLGATDDVEVIAAELGARTDDVMIVGHLPFLPKLASRLVTGSTQQSVVTFRNAGIVCLLRDDDGWTVEWAVTPAVIG